jgi:Aspartyl protease
MKSIHLLQLSAVFTLDFLARAAGSGRCWSPQMWHRPGPGGEGIRQERILRTAACKFEGAHRIDYLSKESYTSAVPEHPYLRVRCPAAGKLQWTTVSRRAPIWRSRVQNAVLDAAQRKQVQQFVVTSDNSRYSVCRVIALLFLLLTPLPDAAHPVSVKVPFRNVQSLILVDCKVNGNPATFLLDTGANRTIISSKSYGDVLFELQRLPQNHKGPGLVGYSVRREADLSLGGHTWVGQRVSVMYLDDLKRMMGMEFDGLLGQDILRQFRTVRIDYHTHTIDLEE